MLCFSKHQKAENMENNENCEMDKVTLLKETDNDVEFSLPYGWKKFGRKRKNSDNWDFYLISSDNKRFRSNPEIKRYLENNPNVKCDLSVTNTQWSSALKNLKKPNPDLKELEREPFIKSKATSIIPKFLKNPMIVPRSPLSKNTKDKNCKDITPESCDVSVSTPGGKKAPDFRLATEFHNEMLFEPSNKLTTNSKSDSDFPIQKSKRMLIEKIKGIKSTRCEINSKNVTLSKICDDIVEYSLPYGWKKVCQKRKRSDRTTDAYRWDVSIIHPDGKNFRSTFEVERYLDENPDEKCDRSVTNTTRPNDLPKTKSNSNDKDVKLNSNIKRKHALKVQKATKTTEVKSCGFKSLPTLSLVTNFNDEDNDVVSAMQPDNQKPETEINFFNPWNVSDLSVFLRYCCPECDFKCEEAHLFCDHAIDHHENSSTLLKYSLDEELKTKSGQKVARKQSSDSGLNFHDFSEETYNSNTELVEEDVIANNLKDNPQYDEKHDPLTIKRAKKEKNTNEDLDEVAADLKKYDCFVCGKKFSLQHSRRKHMRKFHQNACHICGSTFQTIQETAKHISGSCMISFYRVRHT